MEVEKIEGGRGIVVETIVTFRLDGIAEGMEKKVEEVLLSHGCTLIPSSSSPLAVAAVNSAEIDFDDAASDEQGFEPEPTDASTSSSPPSSAAASSPSSSSFPSPSSASSSPSSVRSSSSPSRLSAWEADQQTRQERAIHTPQQSNVYERTWWEKNQSYCIAGGVVAAVMIVVIIVGIIISRRKSALRRGTLSEKFYQDNPLVNQHPLTRQEGGGYAMRTNFGY